MARTIILSAAHGENVSGKQSPDGRFKEYQFSRRLCRLIQAGLHEMEVPCILIPPNDIEPGLWERVRIENTISGPSFVFPLHVNAAGNGRDWKTARGVEIWTSRGQTKSDGFATLIFEDLQKAFPEIKHWRMDKWSDGDVDKECNFTELMSVHPAALLEWCFQDNKLDLEEFLENEIMIARLAGTLINTLTKISRL